MLVLGSRFHHTAIMSLQTGGPLAHIERPIIDPRDLTIVAYEVEGTLLDQRPAFIRTKEIREVSGIGMIVDSSDDIVGLDDVITLKQLVELHFTLVGLPVVDEHGHKLGKVSDYTLETKGFTIQQLGVRRGILKSFNDTGLLINRQQIIEINDHQIIVRSTAKKDRVEPVVEKIQREYTNPFRPPAAPQPESTDAQ